MKILKNKKALIIIGVVLVVLIAGISIFFYIKSLKDETDRLNNKVEEIEEKESKKKKEEEEDIEVEIPDVTALTKEKAKQVLKEEGFNVYTIEKYDEETPEGHVVDIDPKPGEKLKKGSSVTIFVSKAYEKIVIENYIGKDYRTARGELEAKGLIVLITKEKVSGGEENIVVKQSIKPGTEVKLRDTITLTIPDLDVTYPDFTSGYTVKDVQDFCDQHGVTLKIKDNGACEKGKICSQSRPEGYTVRSGTTFEITVGDVSTKPTEKEECSDLAGECD